MRITWLLPARSAVVSEDGTIDVIGGAIDTLLVQGLAKLPTVGVVLAMRVAGPAREWLSAHAISVLLTDESGVDEVVFEEWLTVTEAPLLEPEREIGVLLAARCEWSCPRAGDFVLTVRVDGEEAERIPLAVVDGWASKSN